MATVLKNFSSLTGAKLLGDLFTFAFFVLFSRNFGQEGLGYYSIAVALAGFLTVVSDFGLHNLTITTFNGSRSSQKNGLSAIFLVRLVLSLVALISLVTVIYAINLDYTLAVVIILIAAYQVIYTITYGLAAGYIAQERMWIAGLIEFSSKAGGALLASLMIWLNSEMITVLLTFPIIAVAQLVIVAATAARSFNMRWPQVTCRAISALLGRSLPFAVTELLRQVSTRSDIVLLAIISGAAATGVYNSAYRVLFLLMFVAHFASLSVFPIASRLHSQAPTENRQLYNRSVAAAILLGIPAAGGLWLIAPDLIVLLYGSEFLDALPVLRILSLALALIFFRTMVGVFLMAMGYQRLWAKIWLFATITNIAAHLLLIPSYGPIGAAYATLLTECVLAISGLLGMRRLIGFPVVNYQLFSATIGTLSFCTVFTVLLSWPLWAVIVGSVFVYALVLYLVPSIRSEELRLLKNAMRGTANL